LTSPVYIGNNVIWNIPLALKVDANHMTRASFGKNAAKNEFASAFIYKLKRKGSLESDADNTKDASTSLQLLVIWNSNVWYEFSARALLIKHSNAITWNEDTLERLHSMYLNLLDKGLRVDFVETQSKHYPVKDTWLLDDATALMTTLSWKRDGCIFEVKISNWIRKSDSMAPLWVPSSM
jgi:hypothetical protein